MVSYFTDFHTSTLNLTEMWWQSNRILLPELFSKLPTNYFTFQIMKSETKSNEISSPHSLFRIICFRYIFFVENVQRYLWHSFWYEEFWIKNFLIFDNIVADLKITYFLLNLSSFSSLHLFFYLSQMFKIETKTVRVRKDFTVFAESYSTDRKERKQSTCM